MLADRAVTLREDGQLRRIAAPTFIAAWIHWFSEYAPDAGSGSPDAWRTAAMPRHAYPYGEKAGPPALFSLEILCRIFGDTESWRLAADPGFFRRNGAIVKTGGNGDAMLTMEAASAWDLLPAHTRTALLVQVDARAFPVMCAHGNAQD